MKHTPIKTRRKERQMDEQTTPQEINDSTLAGVSNGAESVEEIRKEDWVERAIEYEATPKSLRDPKDKMTFIDKVCKVPRATYYYEINKEDNQRSIIEICFKQAKRRTPEVLERLGKKAEEGDNTSIGQFMDYVLERTKKSEVNLKGLGIITLPQKNELETSTETDASISKTGE